MGGAARYETIITTPGHRLTGTAQVAALALPGAGDMNILAEWAKRMCHRCGRANAYWRFGHLCVICQHADANAVRQGRASWSDKDGQQTGRRLGQ